MDQTTSTAPPCGSGANHWARVGAALVGVAIVMGAWAAHGLDRAITPLYEGITKTVAGQTVPGVTKYIGDFKTAAEYQLGQGLGLMLIGLLLAHRPQQTLRMGAWCILMGTLIFSGSLYGLVLTGITRLGAITPIGGVLLIVGWALVASGASTGRK
ncbi:MAG: DUF423 domain-containing protein [Planctomycetota bacterium]|nr:MAG: DUF423 domain-containing protein [Planctomycetota bacterium]